jgi:hypothetical protein
VAELAADNQDFGGSESSPSFADSNQVPYRREPASPTKEQE